MIRYVEQVWQTLLTLSPWLLIGLIVAGLLHLFVDDKIVDKHLGAKGGFMSVLKAVMLGVPLPLCSCGVIPAAIGIKKQSAGNAASIGFLISTPQTGVDSIMVSGSMLGLPFALFKVFAAFVTGIIGGSLVHIFDEKADPVQQEKTSCCCGKGEEKQPKTIIEFFHFVIGVLLAEIWKWLVFGILISAAISTWLPADYFQSTPISHPLAAMLIMLVISLPMYVCATASVPVAAALVHAGLPTGAALVFLMAGPASNIATMGAIYRSFGKKNLIIYLLTIITGSMLFGWFFDFVIPHTKVAMTHHHGEETSIVAITAAIILLSMIGYLAVKEIRGFFKKEAKSCCHKDD